MITIEKIQEYSEIYLQSYLYAMDKTKNQDLAVAVAMGVLSTIKILDNGKEENVQIINPLEMFTAAIMQAAADKSDAGGEKADE